MSHWPANPDRCNIYSSRALVSFGQYFSKRQKTYRRPAVVLEAVLSRSGLIRSQNKRLAFPNSASFLRTRVVSTISLSFSKTEAMDVFALLIAILEIFYPHPPRFNALVPRLTLQHFSISFFFIAISTRLSLENEIVNMNS